MNLWVIYTCLLYIAPSIGPTRGGRNSAKLGQLNRQLCIEFDLYACFINFITDLIYIG